MATIIDMPKLSDTMTVGTLVSWLTKEGDKVSSGDMIAEIETDKATMELEAFDDGILLKQLVKEGEQVDVGTPIAAIGEKGEEIDENELKKRKGAPSGEKEKDKEEDTGKEEKKEEKREAPEEKKEEKEKPEKASQTEETKTAAEPSAKSGERRKVSPLARKIAAEKGVSLDGLKGSGPGGRIVKADVIAAASGAGGAAPASKRPDGAPAAAAFEGGVGPIAEEKEIPVSNVREIIARRLLESKTQIPHFYLEIEIDAAPLLAMRAAVNDALAEISPEQGGVKLSVNDFILKGCAEALRRVPGANTSWAGNKIKQHPSAHVSFAVAIEDGLITPIIRDAQNKSVRQISAEVKSLAWKARNKKLKPEEFTGGTFCVSNLGMYGIDRFSAIINPPNAAILAVGKTITKPVVDPSGQIVAGQRMSLTLSCDHRVVDGAVGAEFLSALRQLLETPALMLV